MENHLRNHIGGGGTNRRRSAGIVRQLRIFAPFSDVGSKDTAPAKRELEKPLRYKKHSLIECVLTLFAMW